MNKSQYYLPKCKKIPKDSDIILSCLKIYSTGNAISAREAISSHEAVSVKVDPGSDFAPAIPADQVKITKFRRHPDSPFWDFYRIRMMSSSAFGGNTAFKLVQTFYCIRSLSAR